MKGAYNKVNPLKLIEVLNRHQEIPPYIVSFVVSFLSRRRTTLDLTGYEPQPAFWVNEGIPQGSPLSPLLFLFYTTPLLEEFQSEPGFADRVTVLAYVDDTYLSVTSESYLLNCKMIEKYWVKIKNWAEEYDVEFAPDKFRIIHFRKDKKTCRRVPNLGPNAAVQRVRVLRILGVMVDDKLKFQDHVKYLEKKVIGMIFGHMRITTSSLGVNVLTMREYYMSQVRSAIAHGCPAWFLSNKGDGEHESSKWSIKQPLVDRLEALQDKCLRLILGGYRRSSRLVRRKELWIPRIEDYLDQQSQLFQAKRELDIERPDSGSEESIPEFEHLNGVITRKLRKRNTVLATREEEPEAHFAECFDPKQNTKAGLKKLLRLEGFSDKILRSLPFKWLRATLTLRRLGLLKPNNPLFNNHTELGNVLNPFILMMYNSVNQLVDKLNLSNSKRNREPKHKLVKRLILQGQEYRELRDSQQSLDLESRASDDICPSSAAGDHDSLDADDTPRYLLRNLRERQGGLDQAQIALDNDTIFKQSLTQYHPYRILDNKARDLIKSFAQNGRRPWKILPENCEEKYKQEWDAYRKQLPDDRYRDAPALWEPWGKKVLELYDGLDRAQGNMLFLCRSGVLGLRKFLYSVKCVDSSECDCGVNEPETAEHLFLRCRHLRVQRAALYEAVEGDLSMASLLTTHAAISSDWAICFFGLSQLAFARDHFDRRFETLISLGHPGIVRE